LTKASGVPMSAVLRTCIGTAGETVPLVADWLRHTVAERVGGGLLLLGDVEIALDAAFRGGPGVLILAGTGSNAAMPWRRRFFAPRASSLPTWCAC
jgi:glucosamine kinase